MRTEFDTFLSRRGWCCTDFETFGPFSFEIDPDGISSAFAKAFFVILLTPTNQIQ